MKQEKHNPQYKLVSKWINKDGKLLELVYGISNEGENEGLEVYFYKTLSDGHYKSFRYINHEYPAKYRTDVVELRKYVRDGIVKEGHKLSINNPL